MNSSAIYSKSGKGVQEASGKTSILTRGDRAVLSAIDGRATLGEVAQKCGKAFDAAFEQLIAKLDKDGFVREVSAGVAPPAPKPPPKSAAKPAAKPSAPGEDLDFSSNLDFSSVPIPKVKPGAPPPPTPTQGLGPSASAADEKRAQEHASSLVKARQEAEARAQKDRDRIKAETEAKLRAETEARLRAEAAVKGQADIEAKLRAESEAKVKAAREAAVRAAADAKAKAESEMKARLDEERKAREEAERKAKEETERAKKEAERARKEAEEKAAREAEELKRKLEEERAKAEAERKAREAAERKAREEAERVRKEAEEKARAEAEALRKQLEEERRKLEEERKREAEERKRRDEEDRKRREAEDRKHREEGERRRREEDEARRKRDEAEERERAEAKERRESESRTAKAAADTAPRIEVPPPPPPRAADASGSFDAGLLADLDSFGKHDEEEAKAKEEAERQARAAAERRAREESERQAREAAERKRREEDERRRHEEEARHAREEEERRVREEEEREQREAEERRRRAKEAQSAAAQHARSPAADDDIGVTDDDLDMDDVKQDERAISASARREAREREAARAEAATRGEAPEIVAPRARRKPVKLGKVIGIGLVVAVVGGLGFLQFMPLPAADYEKAASAALGHPVRIGSARFSVFGGMQIALKGVVIDDVKLGAVSASPELGSIFGERKVFNRIDLEAPSLPPSLAAAALFGKANGGNFTVRRVVAHKVKLQSALALPAFDADLAFGDDGALRSATLSGPDGLTVALTPKGSEMEFELNASQFALPIAPEITLNTFGMKGSATQDGLRASSWDSAMFDGRIAGTANLRWGSTWTAEGTVSVRGINAAVFAPTLLVEGKAEGNGRFTASGPNPEKLGAAARVEGTFTIGRGVLGSVDLSRAIQSGGHGATGSTPFSEISGQGVYDKGAVSLRNVSIAAGNLNAGAALDVAANGALSGRVVADVKTASATLRATVNLGGTVKEPQVR